MPSWPEQIPTPTCSPSAIRRWRKNSGSSRQAALDEPGNAGESAKAYDRILRPLFDILVRTGSDRPLALGRDAFGSLPWTRERRAAAVAGHHHLPYPMA